MSKVQIQVQQTIDGVTTSKALTVEDLGDYQRIYGHIKYLFSEMKDHKALGEVTLTHKIGDDLG